MAHTDKTFIAPLEHERVLPLERLCEVRQVGEYVRVNTKGTTVDVVPFFQHSVNARGLGIFFSGDNSNNITIASSATDPLLPNNYLIHDPGGSAQPLQGTLTINPHRSVVGADMILNQRFLFLSPAISCELACSFKRIVHHMGVHVSNQTVGVLPSAGRAVQLADYFYGNVHQSQQAYTVNSTMYQAEQDPLKYALLADRQQWAGLADMRLSLKWECCRSEDCQVKVRAIGSFPVGNKPAGKYLFEPLAGNNGHWGVGIGAELSVALVNDEWYKLIGGISGELMGFFGNRQMRTSEYAPLYQRSTLSRYQLLGQQGIAGTFPAANVLTRLSKVDPGMVVKATALMRLETPRAAVSCAYSALSREEETVTVTDWPEGTYAPVLPTYSTDHTFNVVNDSVDGQAITTRALRPQVAQSPAALVHHLHAAFSYVLTKQSPSVVVALGADCSLAQSNAALRSYTVFGRAEWRF